MVIPELIRLIDGTWNLTWTRRSISYPRPVHIQTIPSLAEALEKWPIHFLEKAVPQLMPIIYELNNRVDEKIPMTNPYAIIDDERRVHMAHMDIHYGYSVNGVAYLHTEILKNC